MQAWKEKDGRYVLIDETLSSETYPRRDQIKRLGGRWHPDGRHWTVPESALAELRAKKVLGVILEPYCHMPMAFGWVTEDEVARGAMRWAFCPRCDSRHERPVAIIEVLGEPDVARQTYEAEFRASVEAQS